jgi:hypothetical protein
VTTLASRSGSSTGDQLGPLSEVASRRPESRVLGVDAQQLRQGGLAVGLLVPELGAQAPRVNEVLDLMTRLVAVGRRDWENYERVLALDGLARTGVKLMMRARAWRSSACPTGAPRWMLSGNELCGPYAASAWTTSCRRASSMSERYCPSSRATTTRIDPIDRCGWRLRCRASGRSDGKLVTRPVLGGLHHVYEQAA